MSTNPGVSVDSSHRNYRYYELVMVGFVAVYLCSNLIGPAKAAQLELPIIGAFTFGAGVLFFPLSYVFGDILTEVYGYARARKVIWAGFGAMAFAAIMATVVVALPPAPGWPNQVAYETVFGQTPRIVFASVVAFWAGEFVNSFVLAKMKVMTQGRMLWTRTVGSTVFGQAVDSALFYPLAFAGAAGWTTAAVIKVSATQWFLKVAWEVLLTPVTYAVVGFLKRREGVEVFDTATDFSPFARSRISD